MKYERTLYSIEPELGNLFRFSLYVVVVVVVVVGPRKLPGRLFSVESKFV